MRPASGRPHRSTTPSRAAEEPRAHPPAPGSSARTISATAPQLREHPGSADWARATSARARRLLTVRSPHLYYERMRFRILLSLVALLAAAAEAPAKKRPIPIKVVVVTMF